MTTWTHMRALLEGIPDLPGARCKGEASLYERTTGERRATHAELNAARTAALRLCETCPARNPCRSWLTALRPTQRPRGVVAGTVVRSDGHIDRRPRGWGGEVEPPDPHPVASHGAHYTPQHNVNQGGT